MVEKIKMVCHGCGTIFKALSDVDDSCVYCGSKDVADVRKRQITVKVEPNAMTPDSSKLQILGKVLRKNGNTEYEVAQKLGLMPKRHSDERII